MAKLPVSTSNLERSICWTIDASSFAIIAHVWTFCRSHYDNLTVYNLLVLGLGHFQPLFISDEFRVGQTSHTACLYLNA